jgi:hypothetical protein
MFKLHLHRWDGCLCTVCGVTRHSHHTWIGCTCTVCGERQEDGHEWVQCRCTLCGLVAHDWEDETGICMTCGAEHRVDIWVPVEQESPAAA